MSWMTAVVFGAATFSPTREGRCAICGPETSAGRGRSKESKDEAEEEAEEGKRCKPEEKRNDAQRISDTLDSFAQLTKKSQQGKKIMNV